MIYTGRVEPTGAGDRWRQIDPRPLPLPRSASLPHSGFSLLLSNGDGWRGAPGAGPGRLIIDQKDRDGSRGGEDMEERRRSGRNLWNLCLGSRDVGAAGVQASPGSLETLHK